MSATAPDFTTEITEITENGRIRGERQRTQLAQRRRLRRVSCREEPEAVVSVPSVFSVVRIQRCSVKRRRRRSYSITDSHLTSAGVIELVFEEMDA